jgi:hypothetical protein
MATDDEPLDPRLAEAIAALRDTPPTTDLWAGIAPKLTRRTLPGTVRLRWPTALAAGLAIAFASVAGTVAVLRRAPSATPARVAAATEPSSGLLVVSATATPADATLESAIAQVETLLRSLQDQLDPAARVALTQSLERLDSAIAAAEARRRAEPDNAQAATILTATLREKLDVLRSSAVLASTRS